MSSSRVGPLFSSEYGAGILNQSSIAVDVNLFIDLLSQPTTIQYFRTKYGKQMDMIEYMNYPMELARHIEPQTGTYWKMVAKTVSEKLGLAVNILIKNTAPLVLQIYIYFESLNDVCPPISTYVDMIHPNHYLFRVKEVVFAIENIMQSAPELVSSIQARLNIGKEFRMLLSSGNDSEFDSGMVFPVSQKIHQLFCEYFTISIQDVVGPLGKLLGVQCWYMVNRNGDIILVFSGKLASVPDDRTG